MSKTIGIIGCGVIGSGLAERFSPNRPIILFDKSAKRSQELGKSLKGNVQVANKADEVISKASIIFIAVKPQSLNELTEEIKVPFREEQLLISPLAGTPLKLLQKRFLNVSILRIMLNIPCFFGKGIIGLAENSHLSEESKRIASEIFSELGISVWVPEKNIDALTALTSSGPAFLLVILEAMIEAGINMGLSASESEYLVLQTIQGTVTMVNKTKKHPAELKWQISSPAGTTIAGMREMEKHSVRSGIIETIMAAYKQAKELVI